MLRIALIGYGKMGKTIEKLALAKGHLISAVVDVDTPIQVRDLDTSTDVAIEFTRPTSAYENITACIHQGIPIVSGTTGWLDRQADIEALCGERNGAFFYASNYSIGVNIFFALNEYLARAMEDTAGYDVAMKEIHHLQKLDAPSGTAITLAEGILRHLPTKTQWVNHATEDPTQLPIISEREAQVPGTHEVRYDSSVDTIEIRHTAHSRLGFAQGALSAAEWLVGKQGVFGMKDLLGF